MGNPPRRLCPFRGLLLMPSGKVWRRCELDSGHEGDHELHVDGHLRRHNGK